MTFIKAVVSVKLRLNTFINNVIVFSYLINYGFNIEMSVVHKIIFKSQ